MIKTATFHFNFLYFSRVVFDWGSTKTHLFRNPGIAKMLAVERDVKPRNVNFAKFDRREGEIVRISTVIPTRNIIYPSNYTLVVLNLCSSSIFKELQDRFVVKNQKMVSIFMGISKIFSLKWNQILWILEVFIKLTVSCLLPSH